MRRMMYHFYGIVLFTASLLFVKSFGADIHKLIDLLQVDKNRITIYPSKEFTRGYLCQDSFFAEYDQEVDISQLDETILTIPFIMDVIPMVWVSNKAWSIDIMDEDLYHSLKKIQNVFQFFYPSLSWSGDLIPNRLVKNMPNVQCGNQNDVAVLFSGGLDAVCSSLLHYDKRQLLITICGSDIRFDNRYMWDCVQKRCCKYAQTYGHCNTFIRSNFALLNHRRLKKITPEIKNWWACTMQSLGYTSLAAPILALAGYKTLFIASTRTKEFPFPYGTHPLVDNAICFAGIQVIHDGAELDRLAKIETIVSVCQKQNLPLPPLRVCWGKDLNGGNCCKCEKCLRTINELLVVGQDPQRFGFATNRETIMNATQDFFAYNKRVSGGLGWHWRCIQNYIRKLDLNSYYDTNFRDYLSWLASVPIKTNTSVNYIAHDKTLLAAMWEQSCEGMLDYGILS